MEIIPCDQFLLDSPLLWTTYLLTCTVDGYYDRVSGLSEAKCKKVEKMVGTRKSAHPASGFSLI
eukprot:scaffold15874_cov77-Skeletonema_dohrnii-CCMP3373.AAC.1